MEAIVSFLAPYLPQVIASIVILLLALASVVFFFFDAHELYFSIKQWRKEKRELEWSLRMLQEAEYFIAHVIQVGGEFSMIHSLYVYSNEEGGYYFNPPRKFVLIGFNRGGDLMNVMPSELSSKAGFVVDSVRQSNGTWRPVEGNLCSVRISKMKNEAHVRFVKNK